MKKAALLSFSLILFFSLGDEIGNLLFSQAFAATEASAAAPSEALLSRHKPSAMISNHNAHSLERTITKTLGINYLLFLPNGYDPAKDEKWPMILRLHFPSGRFMEQGIMLCR